MFFLTILSYNMYYYTYYIKKNSRNEVVKYKKLTRLYLCIILF